MPNLPMYKVILNLKWDFGFKNSISFFKNILWWREEKEQFLVAIFFVP